MCLLVDCGNRLVWSGHKDGKIRSWKMEHTADDPSPFKEGLSWQAHRGPVISIIMSSYGTNSYIYILNSFSNCIIFLIY